MGFAPRPPKEGESDPSPKLSTKSGQVQSHSKLELPRDKLKQAAVKVFLALSQRKCAVSKVFVSLVKLRSGASKGFLPLDKLLPGLPKLFSPRSNED